MRIDVLHGRASCGFLLVLEASSPVAAKGQIQSKEMIDTSWTPSGLAAGAAPSLACLADHQMTTYFGTRHMTVRFRSQDITPL